MNKEENKLLNLQEYKNKEVILKSYPRYILVELTRKCNLKCLMCSNKEQDTRNSIMSKNLFKRISEEFFPLAEMVDLRGCGESLILPNINEIIEETSKYNVKIRFVTNLCFKRPEVLDTLVKYGCYVVTSIDSPNTDILRLIRGGADLDLIVSNLKYLCSKYKERFGNSDRLEINTVIQKPALEGLPDLVNLASECGISQINFNSLMKSDPTLYIDNESELLINILNEVKKRALEKKVNIKLCTKIGSKNEDFKHICIHPWMYVTFSYDGNVGFCDHLVGNYSDFFCFGNIKNTMFMNIWNSERYQKLRKEHIIRSQTRPKIFKACEFCYTFRYIDFEQLFYPELNEKVIYL